MEVQPSLVTQQSVDRAKEERAQQLRRAMTPTEQILWERLRGRRLGVHFRRQQIIAGFIADFYCHSARLVVEVDGSVHLGEESKAYDVERDRIFQQHDVTVLRVSNEAVEHHLLLVLSDVRKALNKNFARTEI